MLLSGFTAPKPATAAELREMFPWGDELWDHIGGAEKVAQTLAAEGSLSSRITENGSSSLAPLSGTEDVSLAKSLTK